MTIFDTNVWVALACVDDSQHQKAVDLLPTAHRVLLPEYVLIEVCTVLSLKISKKAADEFLDKIQSNEDVLITPCDATFFFDTLKFFRRQPHSHLSFIDVSLLNLSHSNEVITFDRHLAKAINQTKG